MENVNIYKRLVSILISISMIFVSTSAVFASATGSMSGASDNNVQKVSCNEVIIAELSTICKETPIVENNEKGTNYSYVLKNGVNGYVEEEYKNNGDIHYHFQEGDIENFLIKKADGTFILDGNLVEITHSTNMMLAQKSLVAPSIEVKGKHYNKTSYVNSAPEGTTAAEYSVHVMDDTIDVDFNNMVKNLAVAAIVTILTGGILAAANAGPIVGTLVSLATGSVSGVATSLQTNHPLSVGSKIELRRWQHEDGYQISRSSIGESRFVYKDRLKYYARNSSGGYTHFETATKYRLTRIYS